MCHFCRTLYGDSSLSLIHILIDGGRIYREDESMYKLYLPKYVGVDSETGESLWALVTPDKNGNTVTKSYSVASEKDVYKRQGFSRWCS